MSRTPDPVSADSAPAVRPPAQPMPQEARAERQAPEASSWLAGTVRRGAEPVAAVAVRVAGRSTLEADAHDEAGAASDIVAEVVTDATGQFGVAVPEGRWIVAVVAGGDSASVAVRTRAGCAHHVVLRITASGTGVDVVRVATPSTGNTTHVLHRDGVAVVVDAPRDIDRVEQVLDELGLELHGVLETHLHDDYLTGGRALARRHRASYVVPEVSGIGFDATLLGDGDVALLGPLRVAAIATPGHTDHHTAYHVTDAERSVPGVLLTGGSLLHGFVGRVPFDPTQQAQRARQQYWSVRRLGRLVPGSALVLPTHGARSTSAAPVGPIPQVSQRRTPLPTVAQEMQSNPTFGMDEETFVEAMRRGAAAPPRYFGHLVRLNAAGPTRADLTPPLQAGPRETARRAQSGEWLVDVRTLDQFAAGHVPGSLGAFPDDRFALSLASVVPLGAPLTLIGEPHEVAVAQRQLSLVGIDRPSVFTGDHAELLTLTGRAVLRRATFVDLVDAVSAAPDPASRPVLLDVRTDTEWRAGHLRGAVHRTLSRLDDLADAYEQERLDDLEHTGTEDLTRPKQHEAPTAPPQPTVWVHCASGYRAALAASVLARRGLSVVHLDDDLAHAQLLAEETDASWWCEGTECDDDSCGGR